MILTVLVSQERKIEDIYSFAVNTINIVIECNENTSIFTSANLNVFITRDETFYGIHWKRSKFSFYFIVYTPMRVSDVITYVAKQNMNVMASAFSA